MNINDARIKLDALGSERALDTLVCVMGHGWATASEVAEKMETHIATAVKRLTILHDAGFLNRRVRRGKTRSAQEYSLQSRRIVLEFDVGDGTSNDAGNVEFLGMLLKDILMRLGRFGGKTVEEVLCQWKKKSGAEDEIIIWLESDTAKIPPIKPETMLEFISSVLAAEVVEYGEFTVRALARASLDAVKSTQDVVSHELPSRFFGGD